MTVRWDDARKARLKDMWEAGKSASQIADAFGDVSRNAVIGRLHRSKMFDSTRQPEAGVVHRRRTGSPSQPRPRPIQKARKPKSQNVGCARLVDEPPPLDDAQIPLDQRRDLDRLDGACCHWPVGDPDSPDFFFCGARVRGIAPYCPSHMRRAHLPTPPLNMKSLKHHARR